MQFVQFAADGRAMAAVYREYGEAVGGVLSGGLVIALLRHTAQQSNECGSDTACSDRTGERAFSRKQRQAAYRRGESVAGNSLAGAAIGSVTVKVVPTPAVLSAAIEPPC